MKFFFLILSAICSYCGDFVAVLYIPMSLLNNNRIYWNFICSFVEHTHMWYYFMSIKCINVVHSRYSTVTVTVCSFMFTLLLVLADHLFIPHSVVTAVASHSQMIVEGLVSVQGLDSKGIFCLVLPFL